MNKKKKKIWSLLCTCLLCATVTFCWILDTTIPVYRYVDVNFLGDNELSIFTEDMDVTVYIMNEDGEYVETEDGLTIGNIVPNQTVPFKIRFKNNASYSQVVSISLSEIDAENSEGEEDTRIFDKMFVGTAGTKGYAGSGATPPDAVFKKMSDGIVKSTATGKYTVVLFRSVEIPPSTSTSEYIELNGYFWLDSDADNSYQGISVHIGMFRIVL